MLARGRCKSFFPLQGRVKKCASASPLVHFTIENDTFLDESTATSFLFQFGCLLKSVSYYRSGESRPCLLFIPSYFYRISRDHFNVVTTKTARRYEIFFEIRICSCSLKQDSETFVLRERQEPLRSLTVLSFTGLFPRAYIRSLVFSSTEYVWKSLEGHVCSARGWIHSQGLTSCSFLLASFSPPSIFFSFLFFFSRISRGPAKHQGLSLERESGHELLFRNVPYYNGPPRGEYRASRGEPLEDVFENVGARFSLGA